MEKIKNRFWSKVLIIPEHPCWEWIAYKMPCGYGQFRGSSKNTLAHRFSWEIHYGEIPNGLWVLHKCDNRGCVRPEHLFLGTNKANTDRVKNKGHLANYQRTMF